MVDVVQQPGRMHRQGYRPVIVLSDTLDLVRAFGPLDAGRKADREKIARILIDLAKRHGAQVERRDESPNLGYHGAGIHLVFAVGGVGASLSVDNLHGGGTSLISWFNTDYPPRDFSALFGICVGSPPGNRHHKATSLPRDWYSLAMFLEGGLLLAARGDAFEPVAA